MLTEEFKKRLKDNGQSLKYFYDKYLPDTSIKYITMYHQINGYLTLSEEVEKSIKHYLHQKYHNQEN